MAARHLARDPRLPLLHDHRPADDPDERRGPAGLRRLGRVPRGAPDGAVDDGVRAQGRAARGTHPRVRRATAPPPDGRGTCGAGAELGAGAHPPPPAREARRSPRPRPWHSSCSPGCRHVRRQRSRPRPTRIACPEVTVASSPGLAPVDRRTARRIAADLVTDLEVAAEALRTRNRARAARRGDRKLARRPLEPHRRVARRRGRGRDLRPGPHPPSARARRGQGPPLVVATLHGTTRTTTYGASGGEPVAQGGAGRDPADVRDRRARRPVPHRSGSRRPRRHGAGPVRARLVHADRRRPERRPRLPARRVPVRESPATRPR